MGEHIAVRYLENKGFSIIERNYTKKWGEIDIVARKGGVLHFIEVKSKTGQPEPYARGGAYRPEDGMHSRKVERLKRTLQTYLLERRYDGPWAFGLVVLYLDPVARTAQVRFMEDLIL